ncbi:Retrovirus-related Gag polyprotein from transposon gypsy [Eumeta japonica]|uniref:Retrovirus-related Gag polyprotein from transposon gypsy n=1 Tax=Eumeta variegata TaxID=151549 RepID=A0A4C1SQB8_EUMVA|nr:Retrovirus-related Gag polyprotein from transposon gypsy [Eumeta japonica]
MAQNFDVSVLVQQMAVLKATIENMRTEHQRQVQNLEEQIRQVEHVEVIPENQRVTIEPRITNENQVKLDVFKSLPVFDGNINNYRIWREDATRMMETTSNLSNQPIYAQTLQIVKTKIQGSAAQLLANHGTIFNFYAIRDRLDKAYVDTRPLYVLQDEMKSCSQGRKTLPELYDEINKRLNLIISKISMSGHTEAVTRAMSSQAEEDSVRVFIAGVNNTFIQSTLYGNAPHNLEHAYTIARTIEDDNRHQNLRLAHEGKFNRPSGNEQRHQHQQKHQLQPRTKFRPRQPFNNFHSKPRESNQQYQPPRYIKHDQNQWTSVLETRFIVNQHAPTPLITSHGKGSIAEIFSTINNRESTTHYKKTTTPACMQSPDTW